MPLLGYAVQAKLAEVFFLAKGYNVLLLRQETRQKVVLLKLC